MASKNIGNIKIKMILKLFESGYITEKDISALSLDSMLKIPDITVAEMTLISELQKAVKANKVITFLGGMNDEQQ